MGNPRLGKKYEWKLATRGLLVGENTIFKPDCELESQESENENEGEVPGKPFG